MKYYLLLLAFICQLSGATEINWAKSYLLESQGKYPQAIQAIKVGLTSKENTKEYTYLRMAWLNYLQKKYNQSISYYQQALKLNSQSIDAHLGLSLVMSAQYRWKEASIQAKKVLKEAPSHYAANIRLMAIRYAEKKWFALAQQALKLTKQYPTQSTPWLYLARAQAWQMKKTQAKESYRMVLRYLPRNIEALGYLK